MIAHFEQITLKKKDEETALTIQVQPRTIEFDEKQNILIIRNSNEDKEICINVILNDKKGNYHSYLLGDEFLISIDKECLVVIEL